MNKPHNGKISICTTRNTTQHIEPLLPGRWCDNRLSAISDEVDATDDWWLPLSPPGVTSSGRELFIGGRRMFTAGGGGGGGGITLPCEHNCMESWTLVSQSAHKHDSGRVNKISLFLDHSRGRVNKTLYVSSLHRRKVYNEVFPVSFSWKGN